MEYKDIKGIVLKETPHKESDIIYTVATDRMGKISVLAKGVKKMSSKLAGGLSRYCLCTMELKESRGGMYIAAGTEKQIDFVGLAADLETHCYANYILHLASDLFLEGDPFPELFSLLINTLYLYEQGKKNKELIKCVFELSALTLAGYGMILDECAACGEEDVRYINLDEGDGYCTACGKISDAVEIEPEVLESLKYIITSDDKKKFSFTLSDTYIRKLSQITTNYVKICMETQYSSLVYLRRIQKGLKEGQYAARGED